MGKRKKKKEWQDVSIRDLTKIFKKSVNILAKKIEESTQ